MHRRPAKGSLAEKTQLALFLAQHRRKQYIEGGFVSVDGKTVEVPGARVAPQQRVLLTPERQPVRPGPRHPVAAQAAGL